MFYANICKGRTSFIVTGQSAGQVRRNLIQMGVDPFDETIEVKEIKNDDVSVLRENLKKDFGG